MTHAEFSVAFGACLECGQTSEYLICRACSAIQRGDDAHDALSEARAEIERLQASLNDAIDHASMGYRKLAEARAEVATLKAHVETLLDAAEAAHALLYHYYIVRKWASPGRPEGVDWGDPHAIRHAAVDQLWAAVEPARTLTRGY